MPAPRALSCFARCARHRLVIPSFAACCALPAATSRLCMEPTGCCLLRRGQPCTVEHAADPVHALPSAATVRLRGGNGYSTGRVEVYHSFIWGTVSNVAGACQLSQPQSVPSFVTVRSWAGLCLRGWVPRESCHCSLPPPTHPHPHPHHHSTPSYTRTLPPSSHCACTMHLRIRPDSTPAPAGRSVMICGTEPTRAWSAGSWVWVSLGAMPCVARGMEGGLVQYGWITCGALAPSHQCRTAHSLGGMLTTAHTVRMRG